MSTLSIVLIVILVVLIGVLVALYFLGKRMQKKQEESKAQMDAMAQNVSMLIIDKKRMRIKDAGLPQVVMDQTPKWMRRSKLPIVKAKIGPKVMSLICEDSIFELVPVKKEVKAVVSGIYITSVRGIRGPLEAPPKKQRFFRRMRNKAKNFVDKNSK